MENHYEFNGKQYTIYLDEEQVENPREYDNLACLGLVHKRYTLGDKEATRLVDSLVADCNGWAGLAASLKIIVDPAVILPVYGYDHGSLDLSTEIKPGWWHFAWDGGQLGFAWITKKALRREYNVERLSKRIVSQALETLKSEVEAYAAYVRGDYYFSFIIEDESGVLVGRSDEWYDTDDDALEAAQKMIENLEVKGVA